jgi:hypothetical protein
MDIVQSCIRETNGSYTLEITLKIDNIITVGPLALPITQLQATLLGLLGVPSCSS